MKVKKGSTSRSVEIRLLNAGVPVTNATFESAGISLAYRRTGEVVTSITPADLADLEAAWSEGGFLAIRDGYYRLDVPDAACATGASKCIVFASIDGATCVAVEIELVDYDPEDGDTLGLAVFDDPLEANVVQVLSTSLTETVAGYLAAGFKKLFDVASPVFTLASINQTGDAYGLINTRLTSARAGYLDNLNVGGLVAAQSDINTLNQSASRRLTITTVQQFERPESSSTAYIVEVRTYDGDGAAVNADSTPTLAATGATSGNLSANLSSATNPETGLYSWTYSVANYATLEQIRFAVSATISAQTFPLSHLAQVCDYVAVPFNTTHASQLAAVYNKLPSKSYLAGSNNSDGDIQIDEATGTPANTAADGTLLTRVGTPGGASLSADLAAVKSDTAAILDDTGTAGVALANGSLKAATFNADLATEPSAKPTTYPGWLMWLVSRFRHAENDGETLTVKKENGDAITEQEVSNEGGVQSVGPPT